MKDALWYLLAFFGIWQASIYLRERGRMKWLEKLAPIGKWGVETGKLMAEKAGKEVQAKAVEYAGKIGLAFIAASVGLAGIGTAALTLNPALQELLVQQIVTGPPGGGPRAQPPTAGGGPPPGASYDPPATPTAVVTVLDTSNLVVTVPPFNGDQDDTYDSLRILVDSAGKGFGTPLVDQRTGPVLVDTITDNANFTTGMVVDVVVLQKGENGGWSDTSAVAQKTIDTKPSPITTLTVIAQTDTSITLRWVTTPNGIGGVSFHNHRFEDITGGAEVYTWGGANEFANQFFDSLGVNPGDTVQFEKKGLSPGRTYEFGVLAYRGEPDVNATYAATVPISGQTTAVGTTTGGSPGGPPGTPALSLAPTADTSNVQMNSSGFNGPGQTHDSTRWVLDNNSDLSSPFLDLRTTTNLTSFLYTSNANLTAGVTYYGAVYHFGNPGGWSARSNIASVVNSAPSTDHPNEPPGMIPLAETDFCDANTGVAGDGYTGQSQFQKGGWNLGNLNQQSTLSGHANGHKLTLQSVSNTGGETPPFPPRGGDCFMSQNFDSGVDWQGGAGRPAPGVYNPNVVGGPFPTGGVKRIYVHWIAYVSTDWTHNVASFQKTGYVVNGGGGEVNHFMIHGFAGPANTQSGGGRVKFNLQSDKTIKNAPNGGPAPYACVTNNWSRNYEYNSADNEITPESSGFFSFGEWVEFELEIWMNDNDLCNGGLRVWKGQQAVMQFSDEVFRVNDENYINEFDFEDIWGGGPGTPIADMEWLVTYAYVSYSVN